MNASRVLSGSRLSSCQGCGKSCLPSLSVLSTSALNRTVCQYDVRSVRVINSCVVATLPFTAFTCCIPPVVLLQGPSIGGSVVPPAPHLVKVVREGALCVLEQLRVRGVQGLVVLAPRLVEGAEEGDGDETLLGRAVCVLLGSAPGRPPVTAQLDACLDGGVRLFQLREKDLARRERGAALIQTAQENMSTYLRQKEEELKTKEVALVQREAALAEKEGAWVAGIAEKEGALAQRESELEAWVADWDIYVPQKEEDSL